MAITSLFDGVNSVIRLVPPQLTTQSPPGSLRALPPQPELGTALSPSASISLAVPFFVSIRYRTARGGRFGGFEPPDAPLS